MAVIENGVVKKGKRGIVHRFLYKGKVPLKFSLDIPIYRDVNELGLQI